MIKNLTAFSIDAETLQSIHNFKIINEDIMYYIRQKDSIDLFGRTC